MFIEMGSICLLKVIYSKPRARFWKTMHPTKFSCYTLHISCLETIHENINTCHICGFAVFSAYVHCTYMSTDDEDMFWRCMSVQNIFIFAKANPIHYWLWSTYVCSIARVWPGYYTAAPAASLRWTRHINTKRLYDRYYLFWTSESAHEHFSLDALWRVS